MKPSQPGSYLLSWILHGTHAQEGDLVQLAGLKHRHFLFELKAGAKLQTHRGVILHDDLIGIPWGTQIFSHLGHSFFLLQPALGDLLKDTPRNTQILYPKEIGFILVSMGIGPGQHVLEAGTGSGALTRALAFAVGSQGRVTSYEVKSEIQQLAMRNLHKLGLGERVVFKQRDIAEGFDETGVDALFLDVQNPNDYIAQVRAALKPGGFFGCILPTTNQVSRILLALRQHDFAFTEVLEIMLRYYRTEPERLRPTDRMVAHTGFLVFSRPILLDPSRKGQDELLNAMNIEAEEESEII
jgi:tRNA (adenine57-N1/adenine58-N1)-methyltransferase catalytic subunit